MNNRFCLAIFLLFFFSLSAEKKEFLLIANTPYLQRDQVLQNSKHKTVIALDGAADQLQKWGIIPDVILGDFDSVDQKKWGISSSYHKEEYRGKNGVVIVPAPDQNYTDLEKGIQYCDQKGAESIVIINADGARMDHTLGNIRFLRKYYQKGRLLLLQTATQTLQYVKDDTIEIEGKKGATAAIMAFPEAIVTTEGLVWDMVDFALTFAFSESVCNRFDKTKVKVVVSGEALVIVDR